jgi:hypothetical protein
MARMMRCWAWWAAMFAGCGRRRCFTTVIIAREPQRCPNAPMERLTAYLGCATIRLQSQIDKL